MVKSLQPKVLLEGDGSTHATCANYYVIVWKKAITLDAITILDRGMADIVAANPTGVGALLIVEPAAEMPPSEIWQKIATIMSRHPEVKATATVFDGKGLKQAILRAVTTTVNLLTTKPAPAEVFSGTSAASDWLVKIAGANHPERLLGSELAMAVEKLRRPAGETTMPVVGKA